MSWFCTQRCISPEIRKYKETELELRLSFENDSLLFCISSSHLRKTTVSNVLCLASYKWVFDGIDFIEDFRELTNTEPLLSPHWKYETIEYTSSFEAYTLVPSQLLGSEPAALLSQATELLVGLYGEENIYDKPLCIGDYKNKKFQTKVFSVFPQELTHVGSIYENATYSNLASHLLSSLFRASENEKRNLYHVLLHTRPPYFDILFTNQDGLSLINRYPYSSFENVLYYFLYSLNKFKADMGTTSVFLCGSAREDNLLPLIEDHVSSASYLSLPGSFPCDIDKYCLCLPNL